MNRILITTTALVAFAGAASAEVTFGGDVELGYNDDEENGFYFESNLGVAGVQELDNGLEAGFSLDLDIDVEHANSSSFKQGEITTSDFVMWIKSDAASMYFGDTKTAAEVVVDKLFKTAVYDEYELNNRFLRKTDVDNGGNAEAVIRGQYDYQGWKFAVSGVVFEESKVDVGATNYIVGEESWQVGALQVAALGTVNNFNLGFAYQEKEDEIYNKIDAGFGNTNKPRSIDELASIFLGTTYGGFDLTLGYVGNLTSDENSAILSAGYNYGMGSVGFFYINESVDDQNIFGVEGSYESGATYVIARIAHGENGKNDDLTEFRIDGSYDTGSGLIVRAGGRIDDHENKTLDDEESAYIGFEYDLGNGANLLLSHAYSDIPKSVTGGEWEIGEPEYKKGTTMQIGFEF